MTKIEKSNEEILTKYMLDVCKKINLRQTTSHEKSMDTRKKILKFIGIIYRNKNKLNKYSLNDYVINLNFNSSFKFGTEVIKHRERCVILNDWEKIKPLKHDWLILTSYNNPLHEKYEYVNFDFLDGERKYGLGKGRGSHFKFARLLYILDDHKDVLVSLIKKETILKRKY